MKSRTVAWMLTLGLLCGLASITPAAEPAPLELGTAVTDITPIEGQVHDPLLAKALYFRQGECRAALVVCDQAVVSREATTAVRRRTEEEIGIPAKHIAVTASHTHTGRRARADLVERVTEALTQAQAAARPVQLRTGTVTQKETLSFNRRYLMRDGSVRFNPGFLNPDIIRPVGPIDPEVGIALFRDANTGNALASLVNFALHLDTVGKYDAYSADYPYYLAESLKHALGPEFVSLFGTGACGDVNHFDVSRPRAGWSVNRGQTMLTPYEPVSTDASPSPLNAEYIGKALAATVQAALPTLADDVPDLAVQSRIIQAPLATFSPMDLQWAREAIDGEVTFLTRVRARRILGLDELRRQHGETMPVEVQVFRLGRETAVVTLPGEVFVELGLAIKAGSPFANTMVIELANQNDTRYVPVRKAFSEGSYEVVNSRLECGGGEMMVEAAVGLLKELKDR